MTDGLGRTAALLDQRLSAATTRSISGTMQIGVETGGGVRRVADSMSLLLEDVAEAARLRQYVTAATTTFANTFLTGWNASLVGTGSRYVLNPNNNSMGQSSDASTMVCISQGSATTGSNGGSCTQSNTSVFAGDGRQVWARVSVKQLSRIQTIRIGFVGNNSAAPSTGRPANGFWLEYDRAVDAAEWSLVTGNNSAYSSDLCGPAVDEDPDWGTFLFRVSGGSSVSVWTVNAAGVPVERSSLASNFPSTDSRRAGRLFWQMEAIDGASGGFSLVAVDGLFALPTTDRLGLLE